MLRGSVDDIDAMSREVAASVEEEWNAAIRRSVTKAEGKWPGLRALRQHGEISVQPSHGKRWFSWRGKVLVEETQNHLTLQFVLREVPSGSSGD